MKRWLPLLIALALALGAVFSAVAEDPEGDDPEPARTESRAEEAHDEEDAGKEKSRKSKDSDDSDDSDGEKEESRKSDDSDGEKAESGKSDDESGKEKEGSDKSDDNAGKEKEESDRSDDDSGKEKEESDRSDDSGKEKEESDRSDDDAGESAGEGAEAQTGEQPGEGAEAQAGEQPGEGAEEQAQEQSGEGAEAQAGEQPGEGAEEQAQEHSGEGAEAQPEEQPGESAEEQSDEGPEAQPGEDAGAQAGEASGEGVEEQAGAETDEPIVEGEEAGETEEEVSKKVLKIQNWLVALGYLKPDQVTGIYDDATREAVADFQAANGLAATGECDGETYALLKAQAEALIDGGAEGDAEATPTPSPTPAPEAADTGSEASQVQQMLLRLNYLTEADLTGEFDEATAAALAMFQEASGLEATGQLDAETLSLLQAATGGSATSQPGYSAEEIAQLQQVLLTLSYLTEADMTGLFDEATVAALIEFQKANGLEATGLLDEATLAALQKLSGTTGMGGKRGGSRGGSSPTPTPDPRLHGVTPGTALTSTHSSGNKDTSTYGSVDLSDGAEDLDITLMTGAGEALSEDSYSRSVSNKTLTLSAGKAQVQRWQFDGVTLRSLNRSGIQKLTLSGGGRPLTLNTGDLFTGDVYSALRAKGRTDNTFSYTITVRDGDAEIAVDIQGERYTARQEAGGALRLYREAN